MGVLKKYVDVRISEILNPCSGVKDPSDTVALLWRKFEVDFMRDFAGNSTPITHSVFREFLHWLDDCIAQLEVILKDYVVEKVDEKFDGFKWASSLNVYRNDNNGKWYIEMLDQHGETLGEAKELPANVVDADDYSGLKVEFDNDTNTYMVSIKTDGVDTAERHYLKVDTSGAYVMVDKVEQTITEGVQVAEVVRAHDNSRLPLFAPTPFIPSQFSGNADEKIGMYGGQAVYAQHYQPTDSGSHSVVPEGEGRKVITSLFVDLKGHIVKGTYANVNPDGTLGEDQSIDLPTTPEPETPTTYSCVVKVSISGKDVSWSDTFTGEVGSIVDVMSVVAKFNAWCGTNNYEFVSWNTKPGNFVLGPTTPESVTYVATVREKYEVVTPKITVVMKYNGNTVYSYVQTNVNSVQIGQVINPANIAAIDQEVAQTIEYEQELQEYRFDNYSYASNRVAVTADTQIIVLLQKKNVKPTIKVQFHYNNAIIKTWETEDTDLVIGERFNPDSVEDIDRYVYEYAEDNGYNYAYNNTNIRVTDITIVDVYLSPKGGFTPGETYTISGDETYIENGTASDQDFASNTVLTYQLPGVDETFPAYITAEYLTSPDRYGNMQVSKINFYINVNRSKFYAFGSSSNIELSATLSNGSSVQLDYTAADFNAGKNSVVVSYPSVGDSDTAIYIKEFKARFMLTNFRLN